MMVVLIDFYGGCVIDKRPEFGADVPNVVNVIRKLNQSGCGISIDKLERRSGSAAMVNWFSERGLLNPISLGLEGDVKYSILTTGLFCPKKSDDYDNTFIDWFEVEQELLNKGIIS